KNLDRHRIRVAFLPMGIVRRTMVEVHPDVIHIQLPAYIGAAAVKLAQRTDTPVIATLHALPENPFPTRNKQSPVFRLFASKFWQRTIALSKLCDLVTAPSQTACRALESHGLSQPAIPVSNGVDLGLFRPPASSQEALRIRQQLGLPPSKPLVLYAGRF